MALETDIFNPTETTTSRKRKKRETGEDNSTASRKERTGSKRAAGNKERVGGKDRTASRKQVEASVSQKQRPLALRFLVALFHALLAIVRLGFILVQRILARRAPSSGDEWADGGTSAMRFPNWLRESLVRHLPAWVILIMVLAIMLPNLLGSAGNVAGRAVGTVFDSFSRLLNVGQPGYLAPLFTPEVEHWSDNIRRWAKQFNLDPNLLATIMQIESCGWPDAVSNAGASGLFQVMPFHFATGENQLDPDTNAARSAGVLAECLGWADDNAGLSMACYNGGPSVLTQPYSQWSDETQRYYKWGSGIYSDALRNASSSSTLNEWLAAGGSTLCGQAAANLGIK